MTQSSLYIGLMSGTSLDGIDIALIEFDDHHLIKLIAADCFPMPFELREQLLAICTSKQTTLQQLGETDAQLGHIYANTVNTLLEKHQIDRQTIGAIGCHGQTIYHSPSGKYPFTMQIGDANIIAAKTGITTIADFRRKDMAFGGQGAPLVPAIHQELFASPTKNIVVLNIGGISNFTILFPNQMVTGYDTGPGNLLLDSWTQQHLHKPYDQDAMWAKSGKVNQELLKHLLDEKYFHQPAPKSTGRELFNLSWLNRKLMPFKLSPQDIQATLVDFTVISVTHELEKLSFDQSLPCELLVCGGGAKNPLIMQRFKEQLPDWTVASTTERGVDVDYVEAMAFAWLAYQRLHNLPGNIPAVTGASKSVSLGVIYPAG